MELKAYLAKHCLSDDAFGRLVRCSQSQVSRIKRGVSLPSMSLMLRIQAATKGSVTSKDFIEKKDRAA